VENGRYDLTVVMKRFFLLIALFSGTALFFSCKDRMICPAFQSTYILEEETGKQVFSLFGEDSLPKSKILIKKNRYGMIVKVKYRKRLDDMRTVRMKTIYPPDQIDSLEVDESSFANHDNDTLKLEASERSNVRYNYDQRNYMKYIGDDIAKAYERKQTEFNKIKKEKEEKESLEPLPPDRKTKKEEKRKKKNDASEPPKIEEDVEDEWEKF
jgi:hypothetical protein